LDVNSEKLQLAKRNVSEVVTEEELVAILKEKSKPKGYIGFEPSGLIHIGLGLMGTSKIKDFSNLGFEFTVLLADWHAYINDKLDGSIENIAVCARYVEDCFLAMGVDKSKVRFLYGEELVQGKEYWQKVLRVSKITSIARMKRALTIMGRKEEEADLDSSKLIYPAMQVADIFELDVDVALGGMDQRHAHMLARDVSPKLGWKKIVAVHWPLLSGLQGGGRMEFELKMSKSKPQSCIFIHDSLEEITDKINKAFCPPKEIEGNPVIEIWQHVIFDQLRDEEVIIERPQKFGGDLTFKKYDDLRDAFVNETLHPQDLKKATVKYLDEILNPVRQYFEKHPDNYKEMMNIVKPKGQ